MLNGEPCGLDQSADITAGEARDDPKPSETQQAGHDVCRRGVPVAERRHAEKAVWTQDSAHLQQANARVRKQM